MAYNILLVEPDFPTERKSKNYRQSLPLGLLKLASYNRSLGNKVQLIRGCSNIEFEPNKILVTSLFTYWSKYVRDKISYYKKRFPKAIVIVGGIYASLMPEHCKQSGCDEVYIGVYKEAEGFQPAYDLIDTDFQIINTSRGCIRNCSFCGVWKIEPQFNFKTSIRGECSKTISYSMTITYSQTPVLRRY